MGFATNSVTLAGGDSKQVALSGLAIGDATITGTEANSLATSGSVLAHVVAVATVKFVPFVDLNPNTDGRSRFGSLYSIECSVACKP